MSCRLKQAALAVDRGKSDGQAAALQAGLVIGADFIHGRPRREVVPLGIECLRQRVDVFGAQEDGFHHKSV